MNFISFSFLSFLASFGSLTFVLLSGLFMYLFFCMGLLIIGFWWYRSVGLCVKGDML